MVGKRIPPGMICYRCGTKAERRERDNKGIDTGKYICLKCYDINYKYGITYIKPGRYYNEGNRCEFLEKDGKRCNDKLFPHNARKFDIDGKTTWYCERHGNWYRRRLPGNFLDIMKSLSDRRMGILDPNSTQAFGDNCEKLTSKVFGVKRLSEEYDNYTLPLDHSPIPKGVSVEIAGKLVDLSGKVPQTTGKRYDSRNGYWQFTRIEREYGKEFDFRFSGVQVVTDYISREDI